MPSRVLGVNGFRMFFTRNLTFRGEMYQLNSMKNINTNSGDREIFFSNIFLCGRDREEVL